MTKQIYQLSSDFLASEKTRQDRLLSSDLTDGIADVFAIEFSSRTEAVFQPFLIFCGPVEFSRKILDFNDEDAVSVDDQMIRFCMLLLVSDRNVMINEFIFLQDLSDLRVIAVPAQQKR